MEPKFYLCQHCGNLITKLFDAHVPVMCCGEKMTELVPNSTDAAAEKHLPVAVQENGRITVTVGSAAHPMTEAHSIQWIALYTDKGLHIQYLTAGSEPQAVFATAEEKPLAAFAYCNLHGLWKTDLA